MVKIIHENLAAVKGEKINFPAVVQGVKAP
jgi:hypothetical protein